MQTQNEKMVPSNRAPRLPVGLIVTVSAMLVGFAVWHAWTDRAETIAFSGEVDRATAMSADAAHILHLDEVLTMSARMAAATGDEAWIKRYEQFAPELDRLIKEAETLALTPEGKASAAKTDIANQTLVRIEQASFALVRQGQYEAAMALLSGPEYELRKREYSAGVDSLLHEVALQQRSEAALAQRRLLSSQTAGGAVILFVLGLWFLILWLVTSAWRANAARYQAIAKSMEESETRHRLLFESSRDAMMTLDPPSWRFTSGNQATLEMFGTKDVAEFTSLGPWQLSPEIQPGGRASADQAKEMIETAMREGSLFFDWSHRRVTGEVFPATVLLTRIELAGETLLQATVRDITAQRRAEHHLKERMKELQAVYFLSEIVAKEDIAQDKLYQEFTNFLPKSWQYPEITCARIVIGDREFRTENFAESLWKQSAPIKVNRSVVGRIEVGYLEEKPEEDEGPFYKEERLLIDALAERIGGITARKQAAAALRESADQLQTIYDGIADGLVVAEVDTGRIVRVSPTACAMFGYSEREFLEKQFPDLHPAASLGAVEAAFHAQAEDEQVMAPGLPCARKDGSIFLADIAARPIIYAGRRCLVGFFRDITERKDAEGRLRRYARELKRANEEVKQFAYIVSHDLRGPLINLKGFAAELRSACSTVDSHLAAALPHLNEEQQREIGAVLHQDIPQALKFIDASVTRMDSHINAVLKLSRLGRRELSFEKVDLSEVVQGALKTLAHQIEERQVKVTIESLPEVIGDRTAMEQMVGNILTNALNYLEPGRPGEIEVGGEQQEAETTFFVRDNGRGIAESDMPKVFAIFRRAGRQDVEGEGVGLAYAQTLAHRHGGHIRCDSELGVGTTFTVVLSNHPEEERAGNAPTATD